GTVVVARETRESVMQMDVSVALPLRQFGDETVGAARNAISLILVPQRTQGPLARHTEGIDQVERALLIRFGAELVHIRDGQQSPQTRRAAARDVLLNPLRDAHLVERTSARRVLVPARRKWRSSQIAQYAAAYGQQILIDRCRGIHRTVDVINRRAARQIEVVALVAQRHAEFVRERTNLRMLRIDELAALFHMLTGKGQAVGDTTSTQTLGAVVNRRSEPGFTQSIGASEAGESGPDDGDARRRLRRDAEPRRRRDQRKARSRCLDQAPARSRQSARCFIVVRVYGADVRDAVQPEDFVQQRALCHEPTPCAAWKCKRTSP